MQSVTRIDKKGILIFIQKTEVKDIKMVGEIRNTIKVEVLEEDNEIANSISILFYKYNPEYFLSLSFRILSGRQCQKRCLSKGSRRRWKWDSYVLNLLIITTLKWNWWTDLITCGRTTRLGDIWGTGSGCGRFSFGRSTLLWSTPIYAKRPDMICINWHPCLTTSSDKRLLLHGLIPAFISNNIKKNTKQENKRYQHVRGKSIPQKKQKNTFYCLLRQHQKQQSKNRQDFESYQPHECLFLWKTPSFSISDKSSVTLTIKKSTMTTSQMGREMHSKAAIIFSDCNVCLCIKLYMVFHTVLYLPRIKSEIQNNPEIFTFVIYLP